MKSKTFFRFTLSVFRWLAVMIVLSVGALTAPLVYPLAYILRTPLRVINEMSYLRYLTLILYIYLDDEDYEQPPTWWLRDKGLKMDSTFSRFWACYRWNGFRNTIWNFHLLTEHDHSRANEVYAKGLLYKDFKPLIGDVFSFAVLKYVDIFGDYADNSGEYLSVRFSYLGKMFCIYEVNGRTFFRFSLAKKLPLLGYTEIQLGTNDKRYTFRFKIKGKQEVFEDVFPDFYTVNPSGFTI